MTPSPAPSPTAGDRVDEPSPEDTFYQALTARNRGLISDSEQQLLRRALILVAGCGSIGGAVVGPLTRTGAERLVLADPDGYELHNLNRQHACVADVGHNKAAVLAGWVASVNPHAEVQVETSGITSDNVAGLVSDAALVFDGVDVTTQPALVAKFLLHREAKRVGVPVVSGYDIAGVQLVLVYDYRGRMPVLDGRISERDVLNPDPLRFLARVVPLRALPVEIFPELRRQLAGKSTAFPQLGYSAGMFGVLAPRLALDLLTGRPVRARITVDVNDLPRRFGDRCRFKMTRASELARMAPTALAHRR